MATLLLALLGVALFYFVDDDSLNKMVVLFGGGNSGDLAPGTWGWDGKDWKQLSASGIPARAGHQMAYDTKNERVLLFGGFSGAQPTTELWEWNGRQWKQLQ